MTQLRSQYRTIKAAGAEVLLVTFFPPDRTVSWARNHKLPYPLASDDESRPTYRRYGLDDFSTHEIFAPRVLLAGAKATLRTRTLPYRTPHYAQGGGYFIVDAGGKLLYSYASSDPAGHPPVGELVSVLTERQAP